MYQMVIEKLIDTGVMNYLIDNHYTSKRKIEKIQGAPKVLRIEDLSFGFNIWLGFCSLSILAILFELIVRPKKVRRMKFSKIHPQDGVTEDLNVELKLETIQKFRIRKVETEIIGNRNIRIKVTVDAHQAMNLYGDVDAEEVELEEHRKKAQNKKKDDEILNDIDNILSLDYE
jgi:hypothetical protein